MQENTPAVTVAAAPGRITVADITHGAMGDITSVGRTPLVKGDTPRIQRLGISTAITDLAE
jgi:hypothetical protein